MCTTRRHFIEATALGGLGLAVNPVTAFGTSARNSGVAVEPMASSAAPFYRPYRSKSAAGRDATTWVQIDLGASQPIDAVKLYPFVKPHSPPGDGFPLRFRIECSDDAQFAEKKLIADCSKADYRDPGSQIMQFPANGTRGRYVRLTATQLRDKKMHPVVSIFLPENARKPYRDLIESTHVLALSKIEVLSQGIDVALHRPVSVDPAYGNPNDAAQLTRAPRPQGEGMITDNPRNVTSPDTWRPVAYRAHAPLEGVEVGEGLFKAALQNNIRYLLDSFTVDELLHPFRQRAGKPLPAPQRALHKLWEEALAGSNAGRFLMGAGNTLRWMNDDQLRSRLDAVVEGIAACRQPNGYIMAYPEDTFFVSERGAYTRSWVTQGLIEAGYAGNEQAFQLLRGYYDWFNQTPYLPRALRECNFGPQGTVANTRMYFTPVGKPVDLQVVQRYLQENYWLEDLAERKAKAIWQYPYDRPHVYLLTFLEPYLDLYRATGERRYLDAVLGGWELFRENWQAIGGSFSILEWKENVPKAYPLYEALGETCGNAFWMLLNQRLHLLEPEEEKYVSEIEKSIYNVLLANQAGGEGIRYHTILVGRKEAPQCVNTCCEGQATRILGSLPEYIYSIAEDGLYVNLFERSSIRWQQAGEALQLEMDTSFPRSPNVRITVHTQKPARMKLRIRAPSWAAGVMEIAVNGQSAARGTPGSYVTLDRTWADGDTVSFVLPITFKATPYAGVDRIAGRERWALEYGPILMAALGAAESLLALDAIQSLPQLASRLEPQPGQPLHFTFPAELFADTVWVPYFEVKDESFSCFPFIKS